MAMNTTGHTPSDGFAAGVDCGEHASKSCTTTAHTGMAARTATFTARCRRQSSHKMAKAGERIEPILFRRPFAEHRVGGAHDEFALLQMILQRFLELRRLFCRKDSPRALEDALVQLLHLREVAAEPGL